MIKIYIWIWGFLLLYVKLFGYDKMDIVELVKICICDLYVSPQYATTHQATHVNKQPITSSPRNQYMGKGEFSDFKILQQYLSCYIIL